MRLTSFLLVVSFAMLALVVVAAGYVVWVRFVGLDPTLALGTADTPARVLAPPALVLGTFLGVVIRALPSLEAGIAAVVLLASSTFAALLLFELYTDYSAEEGTDDLDLAFERT